ncbi:MAG TPA: DUF805 domain-containing protein [Xanthobacteraceae bacterium]|jgi:uncharacterized membrane protein YhaH (DUF805 family)|nr:DUF805 domain-containing protein [Xanthobacteraceae bacterium]
MNWHYLLDSFDGRISRRTFWIAMGIVGAGNVLACLAADYIQGDKLNAIVDLAFNYPEFAIAVKRGQDRNLPIWLIGIFFAASVLLDLFTVTGLAGVDDQPSTLELVFAIPFTVFGLALLFELGFRKGTSGPNQYGPDPLAGVNGKG